MANISWSGAPSEELTTPNFQVIRSSAKAFSLTIDVIACSDGIVGVDTHHQGRTKPCIGKACKLCADEKMVKRWYGYFAAFWPQKKRLVCVEITPSAYPAFRDYIAEHGSIRATTVHLSRQGDRPNGRLLAEINPWTSKHLEQLPHAFDVQKCLKRMWQITEDTVPLKRADGTTAGDLAIVRDPGEHQESVDQQPGCTISTTRGQNEELAPTNGDGNGRAA